METIFVHLANQILKNISQSSKIKYSKIQVIGHIFHLLVFDRISSTMIIAQKWSKQDVTENESFIFIAQQQSKGQGQNTNSWLSPPGNIYMTILTLIKPKQLELLSCIVAVSILETLQIFLQKQLQIKWINDIFIDDKKICGTLIRTQYLNDQQLFLTQIGIGINVKSSPIQGSTCMEKLSNKKFQCMTIIKKLTDILYRNIHKQYQQGSFSKIYTKKVMYLNQYVYIYDVKLENVLHQGKFLKVDDKCKAILQTKDNKIVTVSDGRMRNIDFYLSNQKNQ